MRSATTPRHHRRRIIAGGAVAVAALIGSACGDDDSDADAPAATDAPTTTVHDMSSMPAEMPAITVNAVDYKFEDLPATIPAGTKLDFTNSSTKEVHEMVVLGPLPADETRSAEELLALPEDEVPPVEPVLVVIAPPGGEPIMAVGDGTISEPGRYVVACFIPIGADPGEFLAAMQEASDGPPAVDGGPPHFTGGMFADLIVE